MKAVEVKEFSTPRDQEYCASAYPGDGAYLNQDGAIYFVKGAAICWVSADHASAAMKDGSPSAYIDVHRFLDQLLALK